MFCEATGVAVAAFVVGVSVSVGAGEDASASVSGVGVGSSGAVGVDDGTRDSDVDEAGISAVFVGRDTDVSDAAGSAAGGLSVGTDGAAGLVAHPRRSMRRRMTRRTMVTANLNRS